MEEAINSTVRLPERSESPVKLRSYQDEMLEASLSRNVIIAMDTGSGKTHVAIFRILAELEKCDTSKLVWFTSPSVALSEQQHELIAEHLPGYLVKTLLGKDGVDKWSDEALWSAFLTNVRVVAGTPAVLEQALTHGFVKISRLSLVVFDEAHRCIEGAPMNVIMANFYHPAKRKGEDIPHILGLTASPVMRGELGDLATIESNLDATAITPTQYRSELEEFVHPPTMSCATYNNNSIDDIQIPQLCRALNHSVDFYDIDNDPYILQLRELGSEESLRKLEKHATNPKTFCYRQLKAMRQRCNALLEQLGAAAAEWYVRKCIKRYLDSGDPDALVLADVNEQERKHLASIFRGLSAPTENEIERLSISEKARLLFSVLSQEASPSVRGIVFVEQRAVVHALAHLLRQEPDINNKFAIGTFVGGSNIYSKTAVADLIVIKEQQEDLARFRDGRVNLMIATNVLEEGIDVSACNMVICFDQPKNLVSFVQRRGRARQKDSKYVVFVRADDLKSDPSKWQNLEAKMRQAYMDEHGAPVEIGANEVDESEEEFYRVASTGAVLTLANAKAHLYHFCAVSSLHASRYIDLRPTFHCTNNGGSMPHTAHAQLPSFVHPAIRTASSARSWRSEASAIKDAAFQAYVALHKAGLVNDNLLPLAKDTGANDDQLHKDQPSVVEVAEQLSPWKMLFTDTGYDNAKWHAGELRLSLGEEMVVRVSVWLPVSVPVVSPFSLYWNQHVTYMVDIRPTPEAGTLSGCSEAVVTMRQLTRIVLHSIHGNRLSTEIDDFPVLFSLPEDHNSLARNSDTEGVVPATTLCDHDLSSLDTGLVRWKGDAGRPFMFSQIISGGYSPDSNAETQVLVTSFPKRRDFLHPVLGQDGQNAAYAATQCFPVSECTIDRLPAKYALLAAFVPSITHRLEVCLLAQYLQHGVLEAVDIIDTSLVMEAISAPAAAEAVDYNRLEFLGDSILKFCAVLQALTWHPNWPEGYLHSEKKRLVSNVTLTKAAQKAGLDRFILAKQFTGRKWRPTYVSEVVSDEQAGRRELSSKVLADVVEALIGAAYVDGGLEKSFRCIRTFLPEEDWYPQSHSIARLLEDIIPSPGQRTDLALLQQMIGHDFAHPSLLVEAITHVSFPYSHSGLSYERLEFLGDAVLDLIIVPKLFAHSRKLKHWQLHNIHKALVNGDFLGFCCMKYTIDEEKFDVVQRPSRSISTFEVNRSARPLHLHDFLRAGGQVVQAKRQSLGAFEKFRSSVEEAFESGDMYPWPDLIAMSPHKFFSDIVESILGAIYLDTSGDLSSCEAFLETLGVLSCMQRILDDDIETASPKEQLGILAGQQSVQYLTRTYEISDGTKRFASTVQLAAVDVAGANECASKEEAEARAASEAVKILVTKTEIEGRPNLLKRKLDIVVEGEGTANGHTGD